MRLLRPTLRLRMALLYGGLVLLVGISLLFTSIVLLNSSISKVDSLNGSKPIFIDRDRPPGADQPGEHPQGGHRHRRPLPDQDRADLLRHRRHHRHGRRLHPGQAGPAPDRQADPDRPSAVDRHARPADQPRRPGRRAARARRHLRRDARPARRRVRQPAAVRGQRQPRAAHPAVGDPHRARGHAVRPGRRRRRAAPDGPCRRPGRRARPAAGRLAAHPGPPAGGRARRARGARAGRPGRPDPRRHGRRA